MNGDDVSMAGLQETLLQVCDCDEARVRVPAVVERSWPALCIILNNHWPLMPEGEVDVGLVKQAIREATRLDQDPDIGLVSATVRPPWANILRARSHFTLRVSGKGALYAAWGREFEKVSPRWLQSLQARLGSYLPPRLYPEDIFKQDGFKFWLEMKAVQPGDEPTRSAVCNTLHASLFLFLASAVLNKPDMTQQLERLVSILPSAAPFGRAADGPEWGVLVA